MLVDSHCHLDFPDFSGDLDMIVLKALRKEPQRRYESVERFSDDLRRHADGLPVLAYSSVTDESLKVAKCGNAACN